MNSERFVTLDALRGLFAVIVVMFHYALYFNTPLTHLVWLKSGYLMVDAFFVLSGFVMVHASAGRLQTLRDAGAFMLRRFFRLWPLHALILLWLVLQELVKLYLQAHQGVDVAHQAFSEAFALDKLAASLVLVHSLGLFEGQVWNVPSWSISTEFYAYLVFAVVAWRATAAQLIMLSFLVLLAALFWVLNLPGSTMDVTTQGGFARCLCGFFAGVLAYYCYQRIVRHKSLRSALAWLQLPVVTLLFIYLTFAGDGPLGFLAPAFFFLLVIVFASDHGHVAHLLQAKPLRFMGKISYSIYLIHYPLILMVFRFLELIQRRVDIGLRYELVHGYPLLGFAENWQMMLFMTILSGGIVSVAFFSWRWIELPCQSLGKKYARKVNC